MRPDLQGPLRLAGVYMLFSTLWIFGSDYLLHALVEDSELVAELQTGKGLLFILLSTGLIFLLSQRDRQAQRQLLEKLTHNSRLLQHTQRNAGLGSWEYRHAFHLSDEALCLLGRDAGSPQCTSEQLLSWLHPAERAAVQRALQALLEGHNPMMVSARLLQPQPHQATWLMLRGEVDEYGSILGTVQNISAQKRDESALRESERRFRQLFEQTPRIAVQGYDRERRVIYWNQASTLLYGYAVHEVMGRRLEELIVPPAARSKVASAINLWQLGGPPIPAAEVQLQRKDGSLVWVYSSHLMLRNSLDQLELYCVDIDLTELKKMDNELQVSESRYRSLVEHLGDATFITDAADKLSFLNPAWEQISGYPIHESLGSPLQRFMPELGQTTLRQRLEELRSGKLSSLRLECQLLTHSGQARRVELHLNLSLPEHSLHGSLHDVHERHQTQHLQQARNAVLDELLGLRPLHSILNGITRRLESLQPQMRVSIMLLDEHQRLHVGAAPSLPQAYCQAIEGIQAAPEVGSCGHAAASGELVIAEDLSQHPYWRDYKSVALAAGLHACWSLPFKDDSGQVLGTFGIYYPQPSRPSAADIALVTEFTRLAGLAVQFSANPSATQASESDQRYASRD
ncbi:PAS domain S-box protein [Pseudomonas sp.]|uniref:PAS domain S-box protein n=1 Tax=Pseudomonas sp. TaxID=306 RepID=UPI002715C0A5|nr:PAS domain S-box protein [Pseudomonas sp.]MDO9625752.1 PAS domain S-box protein [Pseudomonas sp.]MDP2447484.1 PAS domain S-box protein [Pseudomonas sp.]MDZ4334393.1 PAS domain S-box protein [Pseudomonas sp.]